jgi:hypothetical protein
MHAPSRPSLQAQMVNQMKTNIQQIVNVLDEWAGKPNKPTFRTGEINRLAEPFDQYLRKIAESRRWSPDFVTLWETFKRNWDSGNGSWSDCKPIARQLNERFRQVEG